MIEGDLTNGRDTGEPPAISGVPVLSVLDMLGQGRRVDDVLIAYPELSRKDMLIALEFAVSAAEPCT